MITNIFSHLYPLVSLVSVYGYMPQIKLLLKAQGRSPDICLRSWFMWVVAGFVTFGYAMLCAHDATFAFISFVSLLLTLAIFGILFYNRIRFRAGEEDSTPRTFP